MKRLCIIALFAALVMGCANTPKAYPDLKFMSFNIRLGSQWAENEDGPNAWSQRKEAVVATPPVHLPRQRFGWDV